MKSLGAIPLFAAATCSAGLRPQDDKASATASGVIGGLIHANAGTPIQARALDAAGLTVVLLAADFDAPTLTGNY